MAWEGAGNTLHADLLHLVNLPPLSIKLHDIDVRLRKLIQFTKPIRFKLLISVVVLNTEFSWYYLHLLLWQIRGLGLPR